MLSWLYGAYGHVLPERPDEVRLRTVPQGYTASLRLPQTASVDTVAVGGAPLLRVQDGTGRVIEERPMSAPVTRSEEHTSELQSLMRISYAVFCLKKKTNHKTHTIRHQHTTSLSTSQTRR